jgi:hypothetical protein
MVHLGFGIDSRDSSFFLTDRTRRKFAGLRERLLSTKQANLKDIQSFVGKCNHLRLLFPATSLFTIRCRRLEPSLTDEPSSLSQDVLDEVAFWSFVDSFTQPIPYRLQQHLTLRLFTDASGFGWGAIVDLPSGNVEIRDYWTSQLFDHDICVKEGLAVLFGLQSVSCHLWRRRVDVFVDNEGLVHAWEGLKSKSVELTSVLQTLFLFCMDFYVSLKLHWVPTDANPADAPSRALHRGDSALSSVLRDRLWGSFGPFSFDLLALPSNVFRDPSGLPLPFFSLAPCPSSSGTNVFAQSPPSGILYAFPPFALIVPLVNLFVEWGGVDVVVVVPSFSQRSPAWVTLIRPYVLRSLPLSSASDLGVLSLPSRRGFSPNVLPLGFGLSALRCRFPSRPPVPRPLALPPFRVVIVSDSMLRPFQSLKWPSPFAVNVFSLSGASFREVFLRLLRHAELPYDAFLVHAGVNDASRAGDDFDRDFRFSCSYAAGLVATYFAGRRVVCSTVCQTKSSDVNTRVAMANSALREFADLGHWGLISNDNIRFADLHDTVHLNASGAARLFCNFLHAFRSFSP